MKLALGTVQFGLPYGIANTRGRPDDATVATILQRATKAGVRVIDTASLYADSEAMLGRCLSATQAFNIVTKTPKFSKMSAFSAATSLRDTFEDSCAKLRVSNVYGLLVHDANDLLGPVGDAVWHEMSTLRSLGRVAKIGVSIYTGAQVDELLQRYPLDLVQLPLSLLDQRLIVGGQLGRLAARGVEVHARSVFLQGALLMQPKDLPSHLEPLKPYIEHIAAQATRCGSDTINVSLRFVADLPQVTAVVCGVDGADQFEQLLATLRSTTPSLSAVDAASCACVDLTLLDPSRWPPA